MNFTVSVLMLTILSLLSGCGQKRPIRELNPSVRAAYQTKVENLLAKLSGSSHSGQLNDSEYNSVVTEITQLRDLVPVSGIVKRMHLDNLETSGIWNLEGQPGVRIDSILAWVVCRSPIRLSDGDVEIGSYYSRRYWTLNPTPVLSHVSPAGQPFDYDHAAPQYSLAPNEIILTPKIVTISTGRYQGCNAARIILNYTGFSANTIAALAAWKASMSSVLADLQEFRTENRNNYELPYVINLVQRKIHSAISNLP